MRRGRLQARLDKLMLTRGKVGKMVTLFPDDWAEDARAAYDAATLADDTETMAAMILQETGEVVDFDDDAFMQVIEIRSQNYGPA